MDTLGGEESSSPSAITKFFVSISQVLTLWLKLELNFLCFKGMNCEYTDCVQIEYRD